ncbi:MAG TPA: GNAT family N-acetyltransferase [Anaerolineales bacterium]|nr:GNAT family N-acetyltransferase [Anaerolineales bacterium]
MFIEKVSDLSTELYQAVCKLVPQLGDYNLVPSWDAMVALLDSEASTLLAARYPDKQSEIVGILTVSIYRVPTGVRSIIEDVIVDESIRRRGIAKGLLRAALEIAREAGANGVALTSNPQRVEANLLYQDMGFVRRKTNAYFYQLK